MDDENSKRQIDEIFEKCEKLKLYFKGVKNEIPRKSETKEVIEELM